jgi:hypothetical protein
MLVWPTTGETAKALTLATYVSPQYLAVTGYFPTGYLPGSLPIGALPTEVTGGGSLRGKSAADATPTKANVATTASTSFVMTKLLSCPAVGSIPSNMRGAALSQSESARCAVRRPPVTPSGAKTRSGTPCRAPAVAGRRRCRMHGGAPRSWGSAKQFITNSSMK